jgi:hypothetical protein
MCGHDALLRHAEDVARTLQLPELRRSPATSRSTHAADSMHSGASRQLVHMKRAIELDEVAR